MASARQQENAEPWPVWWNGQIVPAHEATLLATAPATVHGLGTFETLRIDDGCVFRPEAHWQRLRRGAAELRIPAPSLTGFLGALRDLAAAIAEPSLRLRFSVLDAGDGSAAWLAVAQEIQPIPPARLILTDFRLAAQSPLSEAKPSSYAIPMILQRRAAAAGGSDALVLAADGSVAEAAMSNLFAVVHGRVMTPPLSSGCLPGITRHTVLACCETLSLNVSETRLTIDDLRAADELFLTSAVRRIQPVSHFAPRIFPDAPGPITARLTEALHAIIDRKSVQL